MTKTKTLTTIVVIATLGAALTGCTGEVKKTTGNEEPIEGKTYSLTDTVNLTESPTWGEGTKKSLTQKNGWDVYESSNGAATGTEKSVSNSFLAQKDTCSVIVSNSWQTAEGSPKTQAFNTEAFLYQIADNSPNQDAETIPTDLITVKMGEADGLDLMVLKYDKETQLAESEFTPTTGIIAGRVFNSIAKIDGVTVNEAVFIQYECQDSVPLDTKVWDKVIADASLNVKMVASEDK